MPEYGAQSAHNKNAFDFLATKAPEYTDWQITMLFYAALHSANRHFEMNGIEVPTNHNKRFKVIKDRLPTIVKAYKNLQTLSERSRYVGRSKVDDVAMESALESYCQIVNRLA